MQIPIFYGVNDNYAPLLAVSIQSLIEHADPKNQYKITILYQQLSAENQQAIRLLATNNVKISFSEINHQFETLFKNDHNLLFADFRTLTIYYRIFIADMFPAMAKAIYLDADTLILDDIATLYQQPIGDHLFGAIVDQFIANDPELSKYSEQIIGVPSHQYVNSGVLLMNLVALRNHHFTTQFLDLLQRYHFKLIAADQDYINALAKDKMLLLPVKWNTQTAMPVKETENVVIVHYNLLKKPWHYVNVPFAQQFWETASRTAYASQLKQTLSQYTQQETKLDNNKREAIVSTAQSLQRDQVTLKTVLA
ncbi:glycosyltransferase family 8 protein [Secundilactobacillus folii]|uniref:Glycosyltransferase family 8 protein n=1 Tax=Secundilactobacillus folii TaxID=2678357 RepID=A0A7X3C3G3_9LACO|nr:glycosyltransferase family 8 protein [Secundilactobacillus folii]MTV82591.1 glycosyltransferase family 8 protein [Secundilactobacillus folii]